MNIILEKICIRPDVSIRNAVGTLNDGHARIVLVTDAENRLQGVLADSDVRRAILKGISFDLPVSEIMTRKPVVARLGMEDSNVSELMKNSKCYEIPIVDADHRVVALKTIDAFVVTPRRSEVIIMAGGMGTRLAPLTDVTPKPLLHINGTPLLFQLLDRLLQAGFRKITLAVNYKAELFRQAIGERPEYRDYVQFVQETKRMGTCGALSLLSHTPDAPFFVMNADLMTKVDFASMLQFHELERNHMTVAVREEKHQVPFGVVKLDNTRISEIEEKPVYNYFVNAGIYVINPSVLKLIPNDTYFDMPELINALLADSKPVGSFPVLEYWIDIGTRSQLEQARRDSVREMQ
jgi:dTDP-glucose pyrophosphorylase